MGERIIGHGGKDKTVDKSVNPETVPDSSDPLKTLKDIRYLGKAKKQPKKVKRN